MNKRLTIFAIALLSVEFAADSFPMPAARALFRSVDTRVFSTDKNSPDEAEKIIGEETLPASKAQEVRETELGRMARGIARTGMKDVEALQVGDVVVAKYEIPSLDIWIDSGYEITALYAQGGNRQTGQLEQIPLATLADAPKSGYIRYMKVYSPKYHSSPVVVTPEEIGLVTLKAELQEAMLLAAPGFFWVFVAAAFASKYNDQYGGGFFDAFFRT